VNWQDFDSYDSFAENDILLHSYLLYLLVGGYQMDGRMDGEHSHGLVVDCARYHPLALELYCTTYFPLIAKLVLLF
jgi:hypothetical protein